MSENAQKVSQQPLAEQSKKTAKSEMLQKILLSVGSLIVGTLLGVFVDVWKDSREMLDEARMYKMIADAKIETVNHIMDLVQELGKQEQTLKQMEYDSKKTADYINSRAKEVNDVVGVFRDKLAKEGMALNADQLKVFFSEQIKLAVRNEAADSANLIRKEFGGMVFLIAKDSSCPAGSISIASAAIQISKKDKEKLDRTTKITDDTDWNQSSNYDGRIFKACMYL